MKIKRTPRSLVKEIDGATFTFHRPDLREVGAYYAKRPSSIARLIDERKTREDDGNPMPDTELLDRINEINRTDGEWFTFRGEFILGKLKTVDGLTYEDGDAIPADPEILANDLPQDVLNELFGWYEVQMVECLPMRVTDEKKSDGLTA